MKTLKIIVAVLILTSFTFSCTPQAIDDDKSELVASGGDDSSTIDDDKD